MVHTSLQTRGISHTAKVWHTSRQVLRERVKCYQQQSDAGLHGVSCRPAIAPGYTPAEVEQAV